MSKAMEIATREALINECDFVKGELLNIFEKKDEKIKKQIDTIWAFSDKMRKGIVTKEEIFQIKKLLKNIRTAKNI